MDHRRDAGPWFAAPGDRPAARRRHRLAAHGSAGVLPAHRRPRLERSAVPALVRRQRRATGAHHRRPLITGCRNPLPVLLAPFRPECDELMAIRLMATRSPISFPVTARPYPWN